MIRFIVFFACLVALHSCTSNQADKAIETGDSTLEEKHIEEQEENKPIKNPDVEAKINIDSIQRIIVEDFPISDELLKGNHGRIEVGDLVSVDKAWFTNDSLGQTLVFELYTDYHRLVTYHFMNENIPASLIKRMELHTRNGELASESQKRKNIIEIIGKARHAEANKFISQKGFKLGDHIVRGLDTYGSGGRIWKEDEFEVMEWKFQGDLLFDGKTDLGGLPLAMESYGHQVVMYYLEGKLIGQIIFNDIP